MGIYEQINAIKKSIKEDFEERKQEKAELRQIYREELKKAKIYEVKQKARAKKKKIVLKARENAKGGQIARNMTKYREYLKKKRKNEKAEAEKQKPNSFPPMFR